MAFNKKWDSKFSAMGHELHFALRKLVHDLIRKLSNDAPVERKFPTVRMIQEEMKKDQNMPEMSWTTVYHCLKRLGFRYENYKETRSAMLVERHSIREYRKMYLKMMARFRKQGRYILYTDESYVNAGYTHQKRWHDTNVRTAEDAECEGLTTGIARPTGLGKRVILLAIGGIDGFVSEVTKIYIGGQQNLSDPDYHCDVTSTLYQKWFKSVLENIPRDSVIVMDNASYHNTRKSDAPTSKSTKKFMINWLLQRGYSEEDLEGNLRPAIWDICKCKIAEDPPMAIDELAKEKGVQLVRTPPYHCEFQPIEMIWSFIKRKVADRNVTYKIRDVLHLTEQAFKEVTPEFWQSCIRHCVQEEKKMCKVGKY